MRVLIRVEGLEPVDAMLRFLTRKRLCCMIRPVIV